MNVDAVHHAKPAATHGASEHKPLWVFTPSRTDPKDLEFILVQRQELIQDAVERVRESALTDHKHHLLFVGPRGCGKTHLITLIVSRLTDDAELADRLRIAWLNEDETCTTLLEFLLKIHAALVARYPEEFREDHLSEAYELKADAALDRVAQQLLSTLGPRTLLVVTENLDALFEGLGDAGQKKLRAFIQEHPKLSIVATAQRLVQDLSSRTSPFFGFFQTEHLKTLHVDEANQLLQKIAQLQGKTDLVAFLATNQGRSRVRALHHLSGGNHRIYIVLSQFITRDTIDSLLGPFMKMVDELTPYYQERIRWLPPLQRKIVEYLCSREGTAPVKDIAKRLFATPQTISSQLQDLREKGYVEANQRGRESLYEIREPLMRICVEVKDNQRIQPLRLLVDFLRVWYDDKELKRRLGEIAPFCEPAAYFASAIQRNSAEGNLRQKLILDDLQMSLPRAIGSAQVDLLLSDLKALPESAAMAMQLWAEGKSDEAQQCFHELLAEETDPSRKDELCNQVADALLNRGFAHYQAGDTQHAIEDYTAAIGLTDAPVEQVAVALLARGITYSQAGDTQRAIEDYTTVIGLTDAPVELVTMALRIRGITFFYMGRKQEAESDFQAVVKDARSPLPRVVDTHLMLAKLYFSDGRWSAGLEAIEASLTCGEAVQPAYRESATYLVSAVFSAGLNPDGRRDKVAALLGVYGLHNALPVLGDAVVTHVGQIFRAGSPFPATDNLEGWALAWEEAAVGFPDFGLAMRLLRTGVDYVKAGGKEPGVLLSLSSTERAIVEQALGLSK
ncbi:MAG: tetratricopeptide repeat protein [Rhodoferax sp.]|nr:tetratricopeptide repeat protein [Rhodoferax sp.]